MNKTINKFVALTLVTISALGLAHEGHVHDAPTQKAKIPGAIIQCNEVLCLEVTFKENKIHFYQFTAEQEPVTKGDPKFTATLELPDLKQAKKTSVQAIVATPKDDHLVYAFEPKGIHRFTVIAITTDEHHDTFKYTFEPRK